MLPVVVLGLLTLVACSPSTADPDEHGPPSTDPSAARAGTCAHDDPSQCYPVADILPAYCLVTAARDLARDGQFGVADLPSWASRKVRNGAPVIVDFRHPGGVSSARRADQLDRFLTDEGLVISQSRIDRCMRSTTERDIEKTEGGPRVSK